MVHCPQQIRKSPFPDHWRAAVQLYTNLHEVWSMKMDKATQKELGKRIKDCAKKFGYRHNSGFLFLKSDDNFISATYGVVNSCRLKYMIDIKKFTYDDIFWDVINMPSNKKAPMSLRANGAFAAPTITIAQGDIAVSSDSDLDVIANSLCDTIVETTSQFIKEHQVNDYILSKENFPYSKTLKCLAYLDRNDVVSALDIAKKEIESGNPSGGFGNEGKGFFEWVVFRLTNQG